MRAFVVVSPKPLGRETLGLLNGIEGVYIQPLVPDRSIEPLHIGILLRIAWLDESVEPIAWIIELAD